MRIWRFGRTDVGTLEGTVWTLHCVHSTVFVRVGAACNEQQAHSTTIMLSKHDDMINISHDYTGRRKRARRLFCTNNVIQRMF